MTACPNPVNGIAGGDPSIVRSAGDRAEPLPIAVLSFDRPRYLKRVLLSLRRQIGPLQPVVLFQDGAWNLCSRQLKGSPWAIAECIGLFRRMIPWGTVAASDVNLGIAANYERAEQEMFGGLGTKHALFLEDDMVLSPNYLTVTRMLLDLARHDRRISYVSAYGNFWAGLFEHLEMISLFVEGTMMCAPVARAGCRDAASCVRQIRAPCASQAAFRFLHSVALDCASSHDRKKEDVNDR